MVIQMILIMHSSIVAYCYGCNMYNNFVSNGLKFAIVSEMLFILLLF